MSAILALALLAALDDQADDAKAMQGDWKVVASEQDGKELPEARRVTEMAVSGGTITFRAHGEAVGKATFTLDPAARPRRIDLKPLNAPPAVKTLEGIYELDGDSLRICLCKPGTARPSKFETAPGSNTALSAMKRTKP